MLFELYEFGCHQNFLGLIWSVKIFPGIDKINLEWLNELSTSIKIEQPRSKTSSFQRKQIIGAMICENSLTSKNKEKNLNV